MSEIKEIQGGISVDYRGEIFHVNSLDMSEIERFYIIHQMIHLSLELGMHISMRKNGFMQLKVHLLQLL